MREPAQQNGENERIFPTCQVYRCDNPSQLHCEFEVDEGQEYFVVLMTPTDPFSFAVLSKVDSLPYDLSSISGDSSMITSSSSDSVSLSDFSSVTSPRPLEELEYSAPEPPRSRARSPRAVQNAGGVNGGAKSSSPESEPVAIDGDSSPANAPSAAAESDVTDVSTPDIVTAPPGSLGKILSRRMLASHTHIILCQFLAPASRVWTYSRSTEIAGMKPRVPRTCGR